LSRRREIALRTSLGASRWRVARQLLTENLLIAGAGGTLGVLLSLFAARALAGFFDADNEGYAYAHRYDVTLDWHVAAFAALASIVAVVIFGLMPAMRSSRVDLAETLKNGGDRATSSRARARMVLVAAQVVLSIALLVGAGLLTRSFSRLMSGAAFDPSHVAQIRLRPRLMGYGPDSGQRYLRRAIGAIRATPGVVAAAPVRGSLVNMMTGSATIARPGDAPIARERAPRVDYFDIGPDYFKALGVPMIAGREFTDRDDAAAPLVALVSESLAQRTWHEGKAVGRLLLLNGRQFRVVGVVRDHRVRRFGESAVPTAYVSFWQSAFEEQVDARVAIRVNGDPLRALPAIRRAAESADPRVPVTENQSMSRQMSATFVQVRLGRAVLMASAALALVLSAIGLYGVIAFLVGQRRREIGVRIAVGARPIDVVTLFVRQGLRPIWIGVAGGLVVSIAGAPLLSQWLFGIPPVDPISMVAATTAVAFAAVLASYVPARRAARTDPAAVFRCE
jgi:predicted permease